MPELKGAEVDRTLGLSVEWDGFGYREGKREGKRVGELEGARRERAERAEGGVGAGDAGGGAVGVVGLGSKPVAWSNKLTRKETAVQRRARKAAKREAVKVSLLDETGRKEREEVQALVSQVWEQLKAQEKDDEVFEGFD